MLAPKARRLRVHPFYIVDAFDLTPGGLVIHKVLTTEVKLHAVSHHLRICYAYVDKNTPNIALHYQDCFCSSHSTAYQLFARVIKLWSC